MRRIFDRRQAGLFVTHTTNDRIEAHFDRLKRQSGAFVDWRFICNSATIFELVETARGFSRLGQPRLSQALRHGQLAMGFLDLLIVPLALATRGRFVWIIEYDVDYSGDWSHFFGQFRRDRTDFLATTINTPDRDPAWAFWAGAINPPDMPATLRTRSFLPLFRVSRSFLKSYCRAVSTGEWGGNYEFLFPTIARAFGLTVEDIGSAGPFTPPARYHTNYVNTPNHPHLTPGTFVWRPSRNWYFHEKPGEFPAKNMLYHPVKPGIPEWKAPVT